MLRPRSVVQSLSRADEDEALRVCGADPQANVFVAARLLEGALRRQPGCVLGLRDPQEPSRLRSLVWSGANLVPVEVRPDDVAHYVHRLRRRARGVSSLFGPATPVQALWAGLAPSWGSARAIRGSQPLLSTTTAPTRLGVPLDDRVRLARLDEVDAVLPAAAAMFTEEIGYPPYVGSSAGYRRSVELLVAQGRTYVVTEGREVVFKADVGSVALGVAQVQGVWLAPRLRGQGLAAPAMAAVVEQVLRDTAPTVSLYVNDFNAPARATYARIGLRPVGEFSTVLL